MSTLQTYITALNENRVYGGVAETSHYPALANLLNEIGKSLKPKVRCVINPKNKGAGIPDGGLFTPDQKDTDMIGGQTPSRGVIEAKGFGEDITKTAESQQVLRYLDRYGQVLVTNYWEFILLGRDSDGRPAQLETYRLAGSRQEFMAAINHPQKMEKEHDERFIEYLRRVMLRATELTDPKDVAWFLASYARDARKRVEDTDLPALDAIRTALEEALGLKFEGEKGEHFFRSTLVQTLFYGIFSAWVLWSKENRGSASHKDFDWYHTPEYLHVPMIGTLYHQVADHRKLGKLGLMEVLNWATAALNRVDANAFFERFEEEHAVQYFYEPFLEAFDPELRKELGVWYTPPEIVQYMVARVDTVLREELGIEDGLADPSVYVLDPACGTGAYVVEVLKKIEETLRNKGGGALTGADVKKAAIDRVFGFEILPAPFVVAHLQLGLLLQNLGAPLSDEKNERAGVFLTNALTGWEPPTGPKKRLPFVEFEEERDAADEVKQERNILVILGNPPYNGFAGMAVSEERDLSNAYRTVKQVHAPQGQGLNDLYVRFFRMADRRIVENTHKGVVCFISNYSWLDGLSFTGMRERYLEAFDRIWIDCLNGDKYKTGKLTPEGEPDPSVFSTDFNKEGIQVGTAISLLVKKEDSDEPKSVRFRHFWGRNKRAELADADGHCDTSQYEDVQPPLELGLPFIPMETQADYLSWPLLTELLPVSFPGVKTSRDDFVVDIDHDRLVKRMQQYFDPAISHEEMRRLAPSAMESNHGFRAEDVRDYMRKRGLVTKDIIRYNYRPFDLRWLYWELQGKLLDRNRPEYYPHVFDGNLSIVAQQKPRRQWSPPQVVKHIGCLDLMDRSASCAPMLLRYDENAVLLGEEFLPGELIGDIRFNISRTARKYIAEIIWDKSASALFFHIVAILHATAYQNENAGALRQDWPRIPLPDTKEALLGSSFLGLKIAALLDTENPVPGVTSGNVRTELRVVGVISRDGGGGLNPDTDLAVTAGWGHAGQGGVTMPGKGKSIPRDYTPGERSAIEEGARALGISTDEALVHLGDSTLDIYLNGLAYWKNIPSRVWDYTIGGYQVMKKWLSYREQNLLGRPLTIEEVHEVENMARRIAAILLLEPALDANYEKAKASTYPWPE